MVEIIGFRVARDVESRPGDRHGSCGSSLAMDLARVPVSMNHARIEGHCGDGICNSDIMRLGTVAGRCWHSTGSKLSYIQVASFAVSSCIHTKLENE